MYLDIASLVCLERIPFPSTCKLLRGDMGSHLFLVFSKPLMILLLANYYINSFIIDYNNTFWLPLYQPNSVGAKHIPGNCYWQNDQP